MKIVGTTDKGFLAQVTLDEIGLITGYGPYPLYGDSKNKFKTAIGLDDRHNIKTGTEIHVTVGFRHLAELKEKQAKARACALTLRELADMITSGMPDVVVLGDKGDL